MNPFYFGNPEKPLFGVYHPPKIQQNLNGNKGVLLCYPQAREYEMTHWAMRRLADMLSKAGVHVLRFDYSGTGDSAGNYSSGSLTQWKADIRIAMNELKDTAWVKKVSLVGLRLGATLAALVAEETEVENLVLWDPVVNGKDYMKELRNIQKDLSLSPYYLPKFASNGLNGNGPGQLLGYPSSHELDSSIEEIDLIKTFQFKAKKSFLVISGETIGYCRLRDHLAQKDIPFECRLAPDTGNWDVAVESLGIVFAENILKAITETVTGIKS